MSSPLQRIAADVASQAIYTFNTTRKQRLKRAGLKDTREASSQEPGVSGGPSAPLPTGFSLFKKSDDPSKPAMPARSGIGKWNVMISEGWKNLPEARKNEFKEKAAQQRKKREEGIIDEELRAQYVLSTPFPSWMLIIHAHQGLQHASPRSFENALIIGSRTRVGPDGVTSAGWTSTAASLLNGTYACAIDTTAIDDELSAA